MQVDICCEICCQIPSLPSSVVMHAHGVQDLQEQALAIRADEGSARDCTEPMLVCMPGEISLQGHATDVGRV